MDDQKRTAFAVLISIFVILVYTQWVSAPYKQAARANSAPSTESESSVEATTQGKTSIDGATSSVEKPTAVSFDPVRFQESPRTTIESEAFVMVINHLGARIESLKLKNYYKELGKPELMEIVSVRDDSPRPMGITFKDKTTDVMIPYELKFADGRISKGGETLKISSSTPLSVTFFGKTNRGSELVKEYKLNPTSHLFEVSISPVSEIASLNWTRVIPINDPEQSTYAHKDVVALEESGSQQRVQSTNVLPGEKSFGASRWITLADKYFMVSLVPFGKTAPSSVTRDGDLLTTTLSATPSDGFISVYAGPKEIEELRSAGFDLDKNVDLGFFSFLAQPILSVIKSFNKLFGNFGLAIIAFTLLIKALFLPLAKVSFRSMKKLQDLQPEIQALRERYTDPTELNREMMAMYQKKGVNPLGGCLPILVQIPVFFGLYSALLNASEMRHSRFALWINDLSAPEYLHVFGVGLPFMILLLGASMYYQQKTTPNTVADPVQRKIFASMPFVFTGMFILFPMPSGLVLYWLVNNLISIVQQLYLRSHNGVGAGRATFVASIVIFGIGYALTLIPS